jgi:hypothetical protein
MTQVAPTTSDALDGGSMVKQSRPKRPISTWAIAIGAAVLFSLVLLSRFTEFLFGQVRPSGVMGTILWPIQACGLWAPIFLVFALVGAMWASAPIRTIARQTFVQCLRMRVAAVILFLLGAALVFLPSTVTGDGTLAGRIRTFLSYTTSLTALMLTVASVLMSVRVVSADVQTKQIFTIMTKPIARWQYVLGRWLGLVTLNAALLAVSGVAIYGSAQYLRGLEPASAEDLRAVETEVFSARQKVRALPMDISDALTKRLQATKELAGAREKLKAYEHLKTDDDAVALLTQYATGQALAPAGILSPQESQLLFRTKEDIAKSAQSAAPGGRLTWDFAGIAVSGTSYEGRAKVVDVLVQKAKNKDTGKMEGAGAIRLDAPSQLLGKLERRGWITVESTVGRIIELEPGKQGRGKAQESGWVIAVFPLEEFERGKLGSLKKDDDVSVIAEPVIQVQYKGNAAELPILTGLWTVGSKDGGVTIVVPRSDPNNASSTLTVPARAVGKDGRTTVTYTNLRPDEGSAHSVTILQDDVNILYKVGDFELPLPGISVKIDAFTCNFIRGMILILFQLMFICGAGTLAGSCLSFAVGSLASFVFLIVGLARGFIENAMTPSTTLRDVPLALAGWVFSCVKVVVPDLSQASPADSFVDGLHISWVFVASVAALTVGLTTLVVIVLACAIFRRRELARVQV